MKTDHTPDRLDQLLEEGWLTPPPDFTQRVLQALPPPAPAAPATGRWPRRAGRQLQWLALAGTTAWGALQLLGFVFGIWAATSAA